MTKPTAKPGYLNLSDDSLREIAREGRFCGLAAEHLYQLADEFRAEAAWAELQFRAATLLVPETAERLNWDGGEEP
ncbi:MAG: hypothetical protein A2Y61_05345 [Chloroflexi bacterium RBG_13_60_13]|nr:MAG: hypothetical protein A2Y61_05345 [Chloroflexi bacterium RBG_13_60_13]